MRFLSLIFFLSILFLCLPFLARILFFLFFKALSAILGLFAPSLQRNGSERHRQGKDDDGVIDVKGKIIK
ncbi:MAG TPA: hypothetical protein DCL35_00850 [Candidatus Omnitrophica bacterium]|nr:hypothetical protein [Candidatus Omnitrophota bacterium]